ncbi:hypothetical protein CIW49_26195 [Mycolicibacterium sp. P1-18]|nr:hypothetical protein CIW49_26195 [Mycolicibacterium sp. P1-18]
MATGAADRLAADVLDALVRARTLFGGGTAPTDPPAFPAPRDLEDDLGRGTFSAGPAGQG